MLIRILRTFIYNALLHPINTGCQTDAAASLLVPFAFVITAEAVKKSTAERLPPEMLTGLFSFINSPGGRNVREISRHLTRLSS